MDCTRQRVIDRLNAQCDRAREALRSFELNFQDRPLSAFKRVQYAVDSAALLEECTRVIAALQQEGDQAVTLDTMQGYLSDNIRYAVRYSDMMVQDPTRAAMAAAQLTMLEIIEQECRSSCATPATN